MKTFELTTLEALSFSVVIAVAKVARAFQWKAHDEASWAEALRSPSMQSELPRSLEIKSQDSKELVDAKFEDHLRISARIGRYSRMQRKSEEQIWVAEGALVQLRHRVQDGTGNFDKQTFKVLMVEQLDEIWDISPWRGFPPAWVRWLQQRKN